MFFYKINKIKGLVRSIEIDNKKFEDINEFYQHVKTLKKTFFYGEQLQHIATLLKSTENKFHINSYHRYGGVSSIKIGASTLVDLSGWDREINNDKETIDFFNKMKIDGKISPSPAYIINNNYYNYVGYDEAIKRKENPPSMLDIYLSSNAFKKPFSPAYRPPIIINNAERHKVYRNVQHYDIASAYPYSAIAAKVPVSASTVLSKEEISKIKVKNGFLSLPENTGFIGLFKIDYTLKPETVVPILNENDDNLLALSKYDLELLYRQYDVKEIEILELSIHEISEAPYLIRKYLMELYGKKENLENGVDREIVKRSLNTIVGLWGVDPFKKIMKTEFTSEGIIEKTLSTNFKESLNVYIGNDRKIGWSSGKPRTADVRWAVYAIAFNRLRIQLAAEKLVENGIKVLYSDTDSLKVSGSKRKVKQVFNEINSNIEVDFMGMGKWMNEKKGERKVVFIGIKAYVTETMFFKRRVTISGVKHDDAVKSIRFIPLWVIALKRNIKFKTIVNTPVTVNTKPMGSSNHIYEKETVIVFD